MLPPQMLVCHQSKGCKGDQSESAAESAVGVGTARARCCRCCCLGAAAGRRPRPISARSQGSFWSSLSLRTSRLDTEMSTRTPHSPLGSALPVLLMFPFPDLCNDGRAEAACREVEQQETQAAWIPVGLPEVSQTRKLATSPLLPPAT